jgi:hypothetical protein
MDEVGEENHPKERVVEKVMSSSGLQGRQDKKQKHEDAARDSDNDDAEDHKTSKQSKKKKVNKRKASSVTVDSIFDALLIPAQEGRTNNDTKKKKKLAI